MVTIGNSSRREFIGALSAGVAAAGAVAATSEATAQGGSPLKIVDFHNHYMGPSWTLTNLANVPPPARPAWEKINANLQSENALIASVESAGLAARVINTPTAFIEDADGKVPADATQRINDRMAEVCARHPGKLHGLATVDAFSGDAGARELTRAVKELRLRGVFVESARGDLLLGDKETRPMLKAAADLGVPVFVHPQTDPQLHKRFSRTGRIGLRLARGTINNAALVNMLESGAFDEAPKLQLVVTTLALGGLMLAGGFGDGARIRSDAPALTRRHVYVDTMGINPVTVRAAIDLLGADHVLMGTDWPIVEEKSVPERLAKALAHSGLNAAEQQMVAGGNALRLLGAS
ncbi:MAG TPA: amidohydrolase family protein [Xanthobacteraceae bacterium]